MATHIHIDMGTGSQRNSDSNNSGNAAAIAVSKTYSELKALRDAGQLVPGAWYRITDYECTTYQEDTMSAGHQFDIIVRAIDGSHLSEEAYATHHETSSAVQTDEPDYFANNKLEAWKLMYCLDNDTDRFAWACDGTDKFYIEAENPKEGVIRMSRTAIIEDGTVWQYDRDGNTYYTAADPQVGDNIYYSNELQESDMQISSVETVEGIEGKGVVYRLIDEFGNDCPYDFKNIMFKRFEITEVRNSQGNEISGHELIGLWGLQNNKVSVDSENSEWFYTFSSVNDGTVMDASLNNNYDIVADSEGSEAGNNVMGSLGEGKAYLNNIVFINSDGDLVCYGNRFGMDCRNITLGDWCTDNTFGNSCGENTFGNNDYNNTFGNGCYNNTFGNECYGNTFGNNCAGNTFGNNNYNNTFGNSFQFNTFGNSCLNNTFGNSFQVNTFGNDCGANTFGNYCVNNTFGNSCNENTFGNNCAGNTFGNNIKYFTVFEGVLFCDVTGGDNAANTRKNCQILNGTKGTNNNLLTISFTPNVSYAQVAGFNSSGTLKIWNPADLAN